MIGLITSMVGGVLAAVLGLLVGVTGGQVVWVGFGGAVLMFAILVLLTTGAVTRHQATLPALFPAAAPGRGQERPDR